MFVVGQLKVRAVYAALIAVVNFEYAIGVFDVAAYYIWNTEHPKWCCCLYIGHFLKCSVAQQLVRQQLVRGSIISIL